MYIKIAWGDVPDMERAEFRQRLMDYGIRPREEFYQDSSCRNDGALLAKVQPCNFWLKGPRPHSLSSTTIGTEKNLSDTCSILSR